MTKSLPELGKENTDNKKTEEILSGSQSISIEKIYERHADMVYSVSFAYLKNTEDTKDTVSEIFLKLMQKNIRFNDAEHEKAWLLRATINLCKDSLKHWRRQNENIDDYENNLSGGDSFEADDTYRLVLELPERYKAAVYLHYYEGYTTEEIGGILKKPQSTVLSYLREARKFLKGVIEENEK